MESPNAFPSAFLRAISATDTGALREMARSDVRLDVPGARFTDITRHSEGVDGLCEWAKTVREECVPS